MKVYFKLLLLLALLTVVTFKVITASEEENTAPTISQQKGNLSDNDLRSFEMLGTIVTTRVSLATSGYYEQSGTFWH